MSRTDDARTVEARLARLRERAKRLAQENPGMIPIVGVMLGLLDLLEDEL